MLWAAVLVGAGLRLTEYLLRPSLSVDEATLALNVAFRSYRQLLTGLDYAQAAPPLFLWAERLGTQTLGVNEFGLRLIPLLAGLALPLVVWHVARPLIGGREALLCAWLAACSPQLIHYSVVAKPYATDALVTAVLVGCAVRAIAAAPSPATWRQLVAAGAVAILASIPAMFVLAGVGLAAVLATPRLAAKTDRLRQLLGAGLIWIGLFVVCYLALYAAQARSPFMQQFWEAAFLDPRSPSFLSRAGIAARGAILSPVVNSELPTVLALLLLTLGGAGLAALARREGGWLPALVGGPLACTIVASMLHRYPLYERLMVFAAPLIFLLLASGLGQVTERLGTESKRAFMVVSVIGVMIITGIAVTHPGFAPPARKLIREIQDRRTEAQPVYLYATGAPVFILSATNWASPDSARLRWLAHVLGPDGPAFGNAPSRGRAVHDEGRELDFSYESVPIVLGISTGMQIRITSGLTQVTPDSGWAANEASRIRDAARPDVWLFFDALFNDRPIVELQDALARLGGRLIDAQGAGGARILEYQFE